MSNRRLLVLSAVVALGCSALGGIGTGRAAATRYAIAAATCSGVKDGATPEVQITLTNRTGLQVSVAYAVSFSGPQDLGAGLGVPQQEPAEQTVIKIPDGRTATIPAPWLGPGFREGGVAGALVLTSAGMFLPSCGQVNASRVDLPGPLPTVAGEEGMESAAIAARMIGSLESLRAYPALYALLHPDVQAKVSFANIACWYAAQYGPPVTRKVRTIFTTEVVDVTFVDWTWGGSCAGYSRVAEVTLDQTSGFFPRADPPARSVEHLVRLDGIWRWFFGADEAALAKLPASCALVS